MGRRTFPVRGGGATPVPHPSGRVRKRRIGASQTALHAALAPPASKEGTPVLYPAIADSYNSIATHLEEERVFT